MPKHSVIMTTYNRAGIISRAIRSVINQTEKDWELIVVIDGIVDNTLAVIDSFNDKRIRVVANAHNSEDVGKVLGKVIEPTNYGLDIANGEYISHLDDDDVYRGNRLSFMGDVLGTDARLGAIYCDSLVHYQLNGKEMRKLMFSIDFNPTYLMERNYIRTPEMTYRRHVYDIVGPWELKCPTADGVTIKPKRQGRVASDWWYWKKMLTKMPTIQIAHFPFIGCEVFSQTSAFYNDVSLDVGDFTPEMVKPEWCGQTGDPKDFRVEEFYSRKITV